MDTPVRKDTVDDIINDHYAWKWDEKRNQLLFRSFGGFSAVSFVVAAASVMI